MKIATVIIMDIPSILTLTPSVEKVIKEAISRAITCEASCELETVTSIKDVSFKIEDIQVKEEKHD